VASDKRTALDRQLQGLEQDLSIRRPARPAVQHMIYAPGLYTGYGEEHYPAWRGHRPAAVGQQPTSTSHRCGVLTKYSAELDKGDALLQK